MASRVSYARDTFSRPLLYLFLATISSYLSIYIYIYSYVTKIKRGCWKRIQMLYRAKKQQFINISYHRRLKSLTKLWREKMKGARKKKRERENKEKKTLSTTFRTARDGTRIRKKWSTASNFILNLPGRKRRHSDEREATHSWHSRHVERLEARTTSGAVTSFLWWMCCPLPTCENVTFSSTCSPGRFAAPWPVKRLQALFTAANLCSSPYR